MLPSSIVRSIGTAQVKAGWVRDPKSPSDAIPCALFERRAFSTGLEVGGHPFPLLDPFLLISNEEISLPPLVASHRHLTITSTLGGYFQEPNHLFCFQYDSLSPHLR